MVLDISSVRCLHCTTLFVFEGVVATNMDKSGITLEITKGVKTQ